MSEWLEGYWAAVRHIGIFAERQTGPWVSWSEVVSSMGDIGALAGGAGACAAAWITLSIAKRNEAQTLASERHATLQIMLDLHYRISQLTTVMGVQYRGIKRRFPLTERTPELADLLTEIGTYIATIESYYVKAERNRKAIDAARSFTELHAIKSNLAIARDGMEQHYRCYENLIENASVDGLFEPTRPPVSSAPPPAS